MNEKLITEYFSKHPFDDKKYPIIEDNCEDEGCKLKGDFNDYIILNGDNIIKCLKTNEKSVDRILIMKTLPNNKVDIILCELTRGEKRYNTVVEKIKRSGAYMVNVLYGLGLKIRNFKCIFLGEYKNSKRVKPKAFSISGFHRNDIKIEKHPCGSELSKII